MMTTDLFSKSARSAIRIGFALFGSAPAILGALEQPDQRYLLFMRTQGVGYNEGKPHTVTPDVFEEVAEHFPRFDPQGEILVGVGGVFSYFRYDIDAVEASLRRFLKYAEATRTPVWIKLDGEQWWDARPDLWNWWDPEQPGYDPGNARNVEWSHWGPEHALKIAWRDWGRPLRVLPQPNLASPEYRAAVREAMERLVPIIVDWYNELPEDRKALFAGLNVGWETSIGTSAYYLPNGNDYLGQPSGDDLKPRLVLDDVLSRGVQQIGYAAVSTERIRNEGDIEERDLVDVVARHLLDLSRQARAFGIPKDKLYTQAFGNASGEMLYDAAVNSQAHPGWSEYWNSQDITSNRGVRRNLHRPEVEQWGSVEWLLLRSVEDADHWYSAIKRTINAPGLKLMCIYNWENTAGVGPNVPQVVNRVIDEGLDPYELPPLGPKDTIQSPYAVEE